MRRRQAGPAALSRVTRWRWRAGAARLGFVDILTALILLAILLWASWKQFPAYDNKSAPAASVPAAGERNRSPRR